MHIVTEYPNDLPMSKKGKSQLIRHENNRAIVYKYVYDNYISKVKEIKLKKGENPQSKFSMVFKHMMKEAKLYIKSELGSLHDSNGVNSDCSHAVFKHKGNGKIMSIKKYMTLYNENKRELLEGFVFDGFLNSLYKPNRPKEFVPLE